MNDDLDKLLKSTRMPERSPGYWEFFPKRITALIGTGRQTDYVLTTAQIARQSISTAWWVTGFAAACLLVVLGLWLRPQRDARTDYAKLYREFSTMFPNQVRAIVSDKYGVRVVLADAPDLPTASPLLVNICSAQQCSHIITFSGQQIPVGAGKADVLTDGGGNIIVAGERFVWSSMEPTPDHGVYRIAARRLESSS